MSISCVCDNKGVLTVAILLNKPSRQDGSQGKTDHIHVHFDCE